MSDIVPDLGVAVSCSIIVRDDLVVGGQAIIVCILWGGLVVVRTSLCLLLPATCQLDALLARIRHEVLLVGRHRTRLRRIW